MKHRYLFILEATPLELGKTYDELPSHLTLMSRFFSGLPARQLDKVVHPLFSKTAAMQLVFGETRQLGPKKLTVHLIYYSSGLKNLHNGLLALLNSAAVAYEYPQFIGSGYTPHVTVREGVGFKAGDTLAVGWAHLIEVIEGRRVIRSKFKLEG